MYCWYSIKFYFILQDLCIGPAKRMAEMINLQDSEIRDHVSLSLFILAEVRDTIPKPELSKAPRISPPSLLLMIMACQLLVLCSQKRYNEDKLIERNSLHTEAVVCL